MKLDPVFVLAPRPKPPSMPTRRAFLFMGVAFAGGSVVGGACGYSIGAAQPRPGDASSNELPPTGDAELDALRHLAVRAPIEELVRRRLEFTFAIERSGCRDDLVWRGVARLADRMVEDASFPDRRRSALVLLKTIEGCAPPASFDSATYLERLRPLVR